MFGVDSSGRDTLASQFSRADGGRWMLEGPAGENAELAASIQSNVSFLRKIKADEIRRQILKDLSHAGILNLSPVEIDRRVEERIIEMAKRMAHQGREEQARMASNAAVLRTQ